MNAPTDLPAPEAVKLRDGTALIIRPIHVEDAPRLQALHGRLSPESIFLRFMGLHLKLSDEEARQLAEVDYRTCMAFVAVTPDDGEQIRAVARYSLVSPKRPEEAEAAIVVEDSFQGRGVGTLLLDRLLPYAVAHGIRYFVAEISSENERMMRFVRHSGLPTEKRMQDGVWEIRVRL